MEPTDIDNRWVRAVDGKSWHYVKDFSFYEIGHSSMDAECGKEFTCDDECHRISEVKEQVSGDEDYNICKTCHDKFMEG